MKTKETQGEMHLRHKLELGREIDHLRSELQRVKNDLDDALDVKNGKGPTALSRLSNELQKAKELNGELVGYLKRIMTREIFKEHFNIEQVEELIKKSES